MLQPQRLVGKILAHTLAGRASSYGKLIALCAYAYVHNLYATRCSIAASVKRSTPFHGIHDDISIRSLHVCGAST